MSDEEAQALIEEGATLMGTEQIDLHGYGFVRLDDSMASDSSVIKAARVSFGKSEEIDDEKDGELIRYLMRERHGTPFEHNAFRFHVACPIFVAREWFRHRIGSFNEVSARYKQLGAEFYVPEFDLIRTQKGKPGQYTFEKADMETGIATKEKMREQYGAAYSTYEELLQMGVAREIARCVLPVGIFTQFYWTVNARSLMNFLSLRTAANAQTEIRHYARAVETFFVHAMPITAEAFITYSRTAP